MEFISKWYMYNGAFSCFRFGAAGNVISGGSTVLSQSQTVADADTRGRNLGGATNVNAGRGSISKLIESNLKTLPTDLKL